MATTSNVPRLLGVLWGQTAGGAYITTVPDASQIGITDGAASFTTGFPPLNDVPAGAGGVPPRIQDFNGVLYALSASAQWFSAGGPIFYSGAFSTAISGYPRATVISTLTSFADGVLVGRIVSTVNSNTTNPISGAAAVTGSISGTTLTVTAVSSGALAVGQYISDANTGITENTRITALGSGSGGTGTYTVSQSQTITSRAITSCNPGTFGAGWVSQAELIAAPANYYSLMSAPGTTRTSTSFAGIGGNITVTKKRVTNKILWTARASLQNTGSSPNGAVGSIRIVYSTDGGTNWIAFANAELGGTKGSAAISSYYTIETTGFDASAIGPGYLVRVEWASQTGDQIQCNAVSLTGVETWA